MSTLTRTPIPVSGYVEKVYFNTDLSVEEVKAILEEAFVGPNTMDIMETLLSSDSCSIDVSSGLGTYYISYCEMDDEWPTMLFVSKEDNMGYGFVGWNPDITYPLVINSNIEGNEKNEMLSNLCSITPFKEEPVIPEEQLTLDSLLKGVADAIREKKGTTEKINPKNYKNEILSINSSATVNVPGGWKATPVPNSGHVENVYFNTELSVEEVVKLLEQLDFIDMDPGNPDAPLVYMVFSTADNNKGMAIEKYSDGTYDIFVYLSDIDGTIFSSYENEGWCQDIPISNPIVIDTEVANINSFNNSPVGLQNDILSSLFSTTPITKIEAGKTTLTGEYDGSAIEVTENGTVDIKTFIENRKLPLSLDIDVEGSITVNVQGEWHGTPVPNTGHVEKVYLNTALSVDEVAKFLKELTYSDSGYRYNMLADINNNNALVSETNSGLYMIWLYSASGDNFPCYASFEYDDNGTTFIGWNPSLNSQIEINAEVIEKTSWDAPVGDQNNSISGLFSSAPFIQDSDIKTVLTGDYDGSMVKVDLRNGFKCTPVPTTGYVENIYFNTDLSIAEVDEILNSILIRYYSSDSFLLTDNHWIGVSKNSSGNPSPFKITEANTGMIYYSTDYVTDYYTNNEFSGWNPAIIGQPIVINSSVRSSDDNGSAIGSNNKSFAPIVSLTPIEKISSEYDIELDPYISEQKLPLRLKVQLPKQPNPLVELITNKRSCSYLYAYYNDDYYVGDYLSPILEYDDTKEVINFSYMYYKCYVETFPELNTSNGENFSHMYGECSSATSFPELDVSYGIDFSNMYERCNSATSFPLINTNRGDNFSGMYSECNEATSFPELDTSNGRYFSKMYYECKSATSFPALNTQNGNDFSYMYYKCTSATSVPQLNTSSGRDFSYMYNGCSKLTSVPELNTGNGTNFSYMYNNCSKVTEFPTLYTGNGTNFSYMYNMCTSATSVPQLDTSSGKNFSYMYDDCSELTSVPELNTSSGTDFSGMYRYCSKLTSVPQLNTSNGIDFSEMYNLCSKVTEFPALDTSNGTNFNSMYNGCSSATSFPLIDTSNGKDFGYMYPSCSSATEFPALNTSNGTNFSHMYYQCTSAISFPELDTSNGIDFSNMYYKCKATSFPQLNTSNGIDFSYMYNECSLATSLPELNTSNGTNFNHMYYGCNGVKNFPAINTPKGRDFSYMYYGCRSATSFPTLNTSNGTNFSYMYSGCVNALKIDITKFTASSTGSSYKMFDYCHSLKALIIRSFGSSYILNTNSLSTCNHILGKYHSTYNPEGLKDGYIYVPRDMIEILSTASTWSNYATQLRALEYYTVDGTTTGEFNNGEPNANYYVNPLKDYAFLELEPCTKTLTITLNEFTNIPTVTITSDNEEVVTISNINPTTSEITFDVNLLGVEGTANINVCVNGDYNNEFTFNITYTKYTEPTYSVEALDGVTYGFNLNSNGYYESTNKGINGSYSLCKLAVNNSNPDNLVKMTLECINSGENNYDYGILSNIDSTLTQSNSADSTNVYKSFKGLSGTAVQEVIYNLPSGNHYVYVKFRKDSGGASGNDSLQFKVRFDIA